MNRRTILWPRSSARDRQYSVAKAWFACGRNGQCLRIIELLETEPILSVWSAPLLRVVEDALGIDTTPTLSKVGPARPAHAGRGCHEELVDGALVGTPSKNFNSPIGVLRDPESGSEKLIPAQTC